MGGSEWTDAEMCDGGGVDGDEDDIELEPGPARQFRGVAARLNYIAPDRPDVAFAVKEVARSMSKPKDSDWRTLKKIAQQQKSFFMT